MIMESQERFATGGGVPGYLLPLLVCTHVRAAVDRDYRRLI